MIKKVYVIGTGVSKSLSPLIFNYWFKKNNLNAEYIFKEIQPKNFNKEVDKILNEKNVCGFNVTIPYKELIIKKLDKIDLHSKKIGAVNFVIKKNNKWIGKNTDWIGFINPLLKHLKMKKTKTLNPFVIGYGGAAKAIIYALKKQKYSEIKVFNRSFEKIKHLKNTSKIKILKFSEIENNLEKSNLIINTIPVNIFNYLAIDFKKKITFRKKAIGYDIVYNPKETFFLSNFEKNKKIYGIDMLVYQAVPCFEEWFGKKPIIDDGLYKLLEEQILK